MGLLKPLFPLNEKEFIMQALGFFKHVENIRHHQNEGDFETKDCPPINYLKALKRLGLFEKEPEEIKNKSAWGIASHYPGSL